MDKEQIVLYFVDSEQRDKYVNGHISYNEPITLNCPICNKNYNTMYGSRFKKDGSLKGTLYCKSCSCSKNRQQKGDPKEGDIFGNLTFIKRIQDRVSDSGKHYIRYLCKCDCGIFTEVDKSHLLAGSVKRCKECKKQHLKSISLDRGNKSDVPIGTRFGKLVFLEKIFKKDSSGRQIQYYKCKCDCGNIVEICKNSLIKGLSTSCGCSCSRAKLRDVRIVIGSKTDPDIGQRFGKLVVQSIIYPEIGGYKKVECKCECGNITIVNKNDLLEGKYVTCGHCKRVYPDWFINRLTNSEQRQMAIDGVLMTSEQVSISCYKCNNPIVVTVSSLINLTTLEQKRLGVCKRCSHQTSLNEKEILDFILSLNVPKSSIITNSRKIIRESGKNMYKELDFYLPDYNLSIEYNGSYYHSELKKPKNYHMDKFYLCEEKGIRLISIFEPDWKESKEKILNLIKYSIIPRERIPARKCIVKYVDIDTAHAFYNEYHIQNKSNLAKINIGLYYNTELVAVMGFGSSLFHNRHFSEGDYELHRFVTKTGISVVGGASKLLSSFEKEFKPKFLLSYSWNDWFNGSMYAKLGFKLDKKNPPDYYWYLEGKCLNKRTCRLKDLEIKYPELFKEAIDSKASNKEDYVMEHLGAIKVYRSGSKRWVKTYV